MSLRTAIRHWRDALKRPQLLPSPPAPRLSLGGRDLALDAAAGSGIATAGRPRSTRAVPRERTGQGGHRREIDLDVVRGVAILLAMGWHINTAETGLPVFDAALRPGAVIGWAGVDLFFVLSGFLIGGMIFREVGKTGRFDYGAFFARRVFRLWPTLYFFLLAMLVLIPWRDFFWQVALHVQNYVPTKSATHLWSLAVEEHFYLLLGLALPWVLRLRAGVRSVPFVLAAFLVACPMMRAAAVFVGDPAVSIQMRTHFRLDALAAGVLLAYFATHHRASFDRFHGRRLVWGAVALAGTVCLWFVPKHSAVGEIAGYSVSWVASAAVLLLIYRSGIERVAYGPCLALAFLGQVSYPLYLWHVPVARLGERLLAGAPLEGHPVFHALSVVGVYVASVAVAASVSILIEHPFMRLRDRIIPPRVAAVEPKEAATMPSL